MNANWYIAKYIPDLRRREPINVGIILFVDGVPMMRFLGENNQGRINGRRLRGKVASLDNYRAWVDSWRNAARRIDRKAIERRLPGSSYYAEAGGEALHTDRSASDLFSHLYSELVAPLTAENETRVEAIFTHLKISVDSDVVIQIPAEDPAAAPEDALFFDFRYQNGATTLMRTVRLGTSGRYWDRINAATFSFQRAAEIDAGNLVAFCYRNQTLKDEALSQMRLLGKHAQIVEVDRSDAAERRVAELLHVDY